MSGNIVVTVSGYEAARKLEAKYGIPFRCGNPLARKQVMRIAGKTQVSGKRILVIHEQVTANSCREVLRELGAAHVDAASWFMMKEELSEKGDLRLREESDAAAAVRAGNYDMIIADPVMIPLVSDCFDGVFAGLPHFAVSGRL